MHAPDDWKPCLPGGGFVDSHIDVQINGHWFLGVRGHNADSGTRMLVNRIRALTYEAGISDRFDASVAMSAPLTGRSY